MATTDAQPPHARSSRDDYVLQEVDVDYLAKAVKVKQFIHIDQSSASCARAVSTSAREGAYHMVRRPARSTRPFGHELPGVDPSDNVVFLIDDDVCTRCALCVDRCPTG